MKKLAALLPLALVLLAACTPQQRTAVQVASAPCEACVGQDVVENYASTSPLPFYPQLCDKLVSDCGGTCGSSLVNVISAVAASEDARVKASPAYAEAQARVRSMLAPNPGK